MPEKIPIPAEDWNKLFAGISRSNKSTATICNDLGLKFNLLWSRINKSKALTKRYAQAKSEQSDYTMESSWDRIKAGYEFIKDPEQEPRRLNAMVQMIRVEIDTIKFLASKLKPITYGDKIEQLIKGDKNNPLQVTFAMPNKKPKKSVQK